MMSTFDPTRHATDINFLSLFFLHSLFLYISLFIHILFLFFYLTVINLFSCLVLSFILQTKKKKKTDMRK